MSYTTSNRLLDITGKIPSGNFGVFKAKSMFREHAPYVTVGTIGVDLVVNFNYHFIKHFRRLLAGTTGDTRLSNIENELYTDYQTWFYGGALTPEKEAVVEALDKWLVDELMGVGHYEMRRNYEEDTPWV